MARTYRKTDQAAAKLRKALGVLESSELSHGTNVWKAVGAVTALVEFALIDLDGPTNYQDSDEYGQGASKVSAWAVELPFGEE